jgi:transposase
VAKHFQISIATRAKNALSIAAEAALDGICVVRTNLPAAQADAAATVRAYKSLSGGEHAFRSLKTVDLELRPVFHWTTPRVRAHFLLSIRALILSCFPTVNYLTLPD